MMAPLPWHAIKVPLLLLLVVALFTGAGVWWSSSKLSEAEAARTQQIQAKQAAREKLQRSDNEKKLIQQYQGAYQALIARGFIGAENRLAWLEAVQQANRDAQLYGFDYSLDPREVVPVPLPLGQAPSSVSLRQTVMRIKMPILVEDDLTHFMEALQQRTQSIFRVRMCQISHAGVTSPQAEKAMMQSISAMNVTLSPGLHRQLPHSSEPSWCQGMFMNRLSDGGV